MYSKMLNERASLNNIQILAIAKRTFVLIPLVSKYFVTFLRNYSTDDATNGDDIEKFAFTGH